jgi:hypothetical protein
MADYYELYMQMEHHNSSYAFTFIIIIIIIIKNIQDWAIWPVPSPELQLLSPSFFQSPDCSLSLWAVMK